MRGALRWLAIPLILGSATVAIAQRNEVADRAAIHALLVAYGSTLDARDFEGFGRLFGKEGVYVPGGGQGAKGPAASEMMRKVFAANAMGFRQPNYHIFFNEVVTFDGPDRARATSMSLYMVPDEQDRPAPVLMGGYEDVLMREEGQWTFQRRVVKSLIPAPKR